MDLGNKGEVTWFFFMSHLKVFLGFQVYRSVFGNVPCVLEKNVHSQLQENSTYAH